MILISSASVALSIAPRSAGQDHRCSAKVPSVAEVVQPAKIAYLAKTVDTALIGWSFRYRGSLRDLAILCIAARQASM
eukprot:1115278-Lingulodinium_polyedra.AAC.1